ncbi:hypothetical protein L7F22_030185, partial [Adiantum nelumboides]|nr:hypothetical protein [Adiantum nelumboides]
MEDKEDEEDVKREEAGIRYIGNVAKLEGFNNGKRPTSLVAYTSSKVLYGSTIA